jgi:hypothetical protein
VVEEDRILLLRLVEIRILLTLELLMLAVVLVLLHQLLVAQGLQPEQVLEVVTVALVEMLPQIPLYAEVLEAEVLEATLAMVVMEARLILMAAVVLAARLVVVVEVLLQVLVVNPAGVLVFMVKEQVAQVAQVVTVHVVVAAVLAVRLVQV